MSRACVGGLACRFPNASNAQEFWDKLCHNADMTGPSRWPPGLYGLPHTMGTIRDVNKFDPSIFNISEEEVDGMNPMLWHLLEVVYECVVDSCVPLSALQDSGTGLYLACSNSDMDAILSSRCRTSENTHESHSQYLLSQIANWLDVKGPAVTMDTGCCSSMAALSLAVSDLEMGKCVYAIVMGCNLILNPHVSQQMAALNLLSVDGKTHIFDQSKHGIVRSDGCAALLLTRSTGETLPRIYCDVVDVFDSFESHKKPRDNSCGLSQTLLWEEMLDVSDINVNDIAYMEFTGTGIPEIDQHELQEISEVLLERKEALPIGSVQCNMGHSEAVSGLAGIIKCILSMQKGELPPCVDQAELNESLSKKLTVVDQPCQIKGEYLCVHNTSRAGSRGHVILTPYKAEDKDHIYPVPYDLIVPMTCRTVEGVERLVDFVTNNRYNTSLLKLMTSSLLSCDKSQPIRGYIQIGPEEEEIQVQHQYVGEDTQSVYLLLDDIMNNPVSMATDLLELNCFMNALRQCTKSIQLIEPNFDLEDELRKERRLEPHTRLGMLIATSVFICMIDCLEEAGMNVEGVIGCGISEVIAGYIDGCISRDQCFQAVNCIGTHIQTFATENDGKWQSYEVEMAIEEVYQLGARVQVTGVYGDDKARIVVQSQYEQHILQKIQTKGGRYTILEGKVPMYSGNMQSVSKLVQQELRDIIPAPTYSSCHLFSSQLPVNSRKAARECLFDANHISSLLCRPVHLHHLMKQTPFLDDHDLLTLSPTVCKVRTRNDDNLNTSKGLKYSKSCVKSGGLHDHSMDLSMFAAGDHDDSLYPDPFSLNTDHLYASVTSLCNILGKLHILGHNIDVSHLFPTSEGSLGPEIPNLSHLVTWDHSVDWELPHWLQFSCTEKDERLPYQVEYDGGKHSCVAVLIYHVWLAISEKLLENDKFYTPMTGNGVVLGPVKLKNIVMLEEPQLTDDLIGNAAIFVLPGSQKFAVLSNDKVLMQGDFEQEDSPHLPCIPGYDLDINDNVTQAAPDTEAECKKTEIKWEDNWLDYINETLEFAMGHLDTAVREVTIHNSYHLDEAKECASFLAVVEMITGLCKSGGLVLTMKAPVGKTDPNQTPNFIGLDTSVVANRNLTTLATRVMIYSIHSNKEESEKLVLYESSKEKQQPGVVGIVDICGTGEACETCGPADWQSDDLEMLVPFLLAAHLLYDVARAQDKHSVLVLPPHDTTTVCLIALATQLGCSVYTCTQDIENLHVLETLFPDICVFHTGVLHKDLMTSTQGAGVDICIALSRTDIGRALDCVGWNGQLILCMPPGPTASQHPVSLDRNITISIASPTESVRLFVDKSEYDRQALLFNLKEGVISKISSAGYPEPVGLLYVQENISSFQQPIKVVSLLKNLADPGQEGSLDGFSQGDKKSLQSLQNLLTPMPKDYSMADTSCMLKNPLETLTEESEDLVDTAIAGGRTVPVLLTSLEDKTLDRGMLQTPDRSSHRYSPDVNIITLSDSYVENKMSPLSALKPGAQNLPPTSTPHIPVENYALPKPLEESYLENMGGEMSFHIFSDSLKATLPLGTTNSEVDKEASERNDIQKELPVFEKAGSGTPGSHKKKPLSIQEQRPGCHPAFMHTDTWTHGKRLSSGFGTDHPGTPIPKQSPRQFSFSHHMQMKKRHTPPELTLSKPRLDLLMLNPPMTPLTKDLKEVLTPKDMETVVPLNTVTADHDIPLFIVHPITGCVNLYESLGKELKVPCYGIQRTKLTPDDSIYNIASYYKAEIERHQGQGPYRIAGFSFGSLIALDIVLQLQQDGKKVDKVILLDGSPLYIQSQISHDMKHLPVNASQDEVHEALVTGALVNWLAYFRPVGNRLMIYGLLRKLPSIADKIETAVDLSFGNAIISSNAGKTRWLTAKAKILQQGKGAEVGAKFLNAGRELVRVMRRDKATEYVQQVALAYKYRMADKIQGDVWLFRVKDTPTSGNTHLPEDYGLQLHTSHVVHVQYCEGQHNTCLNGEYMNPLTSQLNHLLLAKGSVDKSVH